MALGARRGNVVHLVLASTAATFGAGIAAGLGLSLILSGIVTAWTGGCPRDPVTLLAAQCPILERQIPRSPNPKI